MELKDKGEIISKQSIQQVTPWKVEINFLMLESFYENYQQRWEEVVFDCPPITNSFLTLSERPGIGIELDEDGLRKYAVEGVPFFE